MNSAVYIWLQWSLQENNPPKQLAACFLGLWFFCIVNVKRKITGNASHLLCWRCFLSPSLWVALKVLKILKQTGDLIGFCCRIKAPCRFIGVSRKTNFETSSVVKSSRDLFSIIGLKIVCAAVIILCFYCRRRVILIYWFQFQNDTTNGFLSTKSQC